MTKSQDRGKDGHDVMADRPGIERVGGFMVNICRMQSGDVTGICRCY